MTLLFIEIPDLLLDCLEHSRFPAFVTDTEGRTELAVKFHDADGGQADVLHVVQVWIQTFGETAQAEGFSHAGTCGEHTDPPCILQVIQPLGHFCHVMGKKPVFFLYHLLVKGIKRKPIIRKGHHFSPPIRE